jgi:peptidoglycan/xylan/chitin deacetylase (PgdA/CDA1 family)
MKKRIFALLHFAGLTRFAAWWNRKRVTLICYHGVTERRERSPDDPSGLHVRHEQFIAQLDYLKRHYRIISLGEYLQARREGKPLPGYSVALTFDDGYRNFLTVAAPRLIERGLPASIFLITDRIREEDHITLSRNWTPEDDEIYLSWDEVRELEQMPGIEPGSHTCSHAKLGILSGPEVEREMKDSRATLLAHISENASTLAYPYGDYSDSVVERARAAGYICALTTDEGPNARNQDLFTLRRTLIGDDDDVPAFAARVSGLTCWLGGARAILRGLNSPKPQRVKGASPARPGHTRI